MRIQADLSALKKTKWHEYLLRFAAGGVITVATGLIAKRYGPAIGGLFLAFPAIFPASATLVEKHKREKKLKAGITRSMRGRHAAALDARGAMFGGVGLGIFAVIVWKALPVLNVPATLALALGAWFGTSVVIWRTRKTNFYRRFFYAKP
jgi:Protein of unknown function (DUF3147)